MPFIYIAGLPHSGTTILELYLNQIPGAVGVGELFRAIQKFSSNDFVVESLTPHDRVVFEGSTFWQSVRELAQESDKTTAEIYVEVYERLLSGDETVIDSSKWLIGATTLMEAYPEQTMVVHNVRDVRGWTMSQLDNRRKKGLTVRSWENSRCFWRWERAIREMTSALQRYGDRYLLCSHDRFCLQHETVAAELSSFLGMRLPSGFSERQQINSRNIMGNSVRYSFSDETKISYDDRWLYRNDWLLPYFAMGTVRRLNGELVWKSGHEGRFCDVDIKLRDLESKSLMGLLGDYLVKYPVK